MTAGSSLSELQIEAKEDGKALETSVCDVITAPSTETPGTEMLRHLKDIRGILFHTTTGRPPGMLFGGEKESEREREHTHISQELSLAL
jgi:hypothetical protein